MSVPAIVLRLESLAVVVATVALYFDGDYAGWAFFAFLLAPDLAIAAYAAGPKVGSAFPVGLAAGCLLTGEAGLPVQIALIWAAHIGIDRVLGLGLKYPTGFKDTHLNRV